ncbi:tetratricopeptide repeat (TPR)-containing protein [Euphorbia peplus]|nr:tetratricopeptide repeat (TPR)-containing protein [Euphorbia peplus]
MTKDEGELIAAKKAYRTAAEVGNREEEARWANVIGDILKNRGEYVKALKWLRIDYDVSVKYLPQKQSLTTCQSLGEVYLRLLDFQNALIYQKMHLELAKDADDIIEQQRANTQLGRTYHEIFLKSEDDHSSIRNAKKYFKSAMELAQILKEKPPTNTSSSSFLKEYIDAHNNLGMLEMDLDNFVEAEKILTKGLQICDDEEVKEDDDARSRLHHNLGTVYLEMRAWDEASDHIKKDIRICKKIGHCQGEAKGLINLGELHYRIQEYDKAIRCYDRALILAKSMEDEDALTKQIHQNIETVKLAVKVIEELKKEEQNFKKLTRNVENAIGKPHERKLLVHQLQSLDRLIDKSSMIFAWDQHCKYAKCKKKIAKKLCDKEKLGDSYLVLGESYLKLRNLDKALKWVKKGWETYKEIGNLEGQALAKNNIGDVLDCAGKWIEALNAFKESYRIAVEANLPSIQLSALENMHYSYMIRFDDVKEARRVLCEISNLKRSKTQELEMVNLARDYCSETDTDGDGHLSDDRPIESSLPETSKSNSAYSKHANGVEELNDDVPLISFLQSRRHSSQKQTTCAENCNTPTKFTEASPKCLSKTSHHQTISGRKRVRVILSDDEGEMDDDNCFEGLTRRCSVLHHIATSDAFKKRNDVVSSPYKFEDFSRIESKCVSSSCNPVNIEESCSSHKSPKVVIPTELFSRSLSADEAATSGSKQDIDIFARTKIKHIGGHLKLYDFSSNHNHKCCIGFRIDEVQIDIEGGSYFAVDETTMESMKVELACLYFLHLPADKRAKGLLPIIHHIKYDGKVLEPLEAFDILVNDAGNILVEVSISGWVHKRLMKLYIDFCEELSEITNMKLLKRLYISEVEDELVASQCDLQDISITPLLSALHTHKNVALLDLSHNLLGNGTMEKLKNFFTSGQTYGGLTLDLHCNRFGSSALFQICECPVLFARLEVLNISGNRLTDSCGSCLSTILEKCKALYSLNIAQCSITSRTIQKVADAATSSSVLAQLSIGHNNPISGNAIVHLLTKLASLESFTELNLNGIKINRLVIDSLCQLAERSCLSRLMLGSTGIGNDGAVQLTESLFSQSKESVKLDLSYCGLTDTYIQKLNNDDNLVSGILELNLEGNPVRKEGMSALTTLLTNPHCCLKVLVLNKCQLELAGIVQVIKALSENEHLEELHLADNMSMDSKYSTHYNSTMETSADISTCKSSSALSVSKETNTNQEDLCGVNINQLEVADSEDNLMREEGGPEYDDCCTSSFDKNSSLDGRFQELSAAISLAKRLHLLDLSNNNFSNSVGNMLYDSWSSRLGSGSSRKHIKEQVIHFSTDLNLCCRLKPCCRKD